MTCKWCPSRLACVEYGCRNPRQVEVTEEMLTAAMRAFEPLSSVLRYRERDKWHTCDMIAMREAIKAATEGCANRHWEHDVSALSAENKRALQIMRLVTELVEQSEAERLEILELREANTLVVLENGRLLDQIATLTRS